MLYMYIFTVYAHMTTFEIRRMKYMAIIYPRDVRFVNPIPMAVSRKLKKFTNTKPGSAKN